MTEIFRTVDELLGARGRPLGPGAASTVDQDMINQFADITHDRQWIHVDVDRTRVEGTPTIAHGMLTLSLIIPLVADCFRVDVPASVNYGFHRVRFLTPVPAGSTLTATVVIDTVDPTVRGTKVRSSVTPDNDTGAPVCVADWWTYYPSLTTASTP
jgi:acyl dehydratase